MLCFNSYISNNSHIAGRQYTHTHTLVHICAYLCVHMCISVITESSIVCPCLTTVDYVIEKNVIP